jgi:hypothetical protein
MKTSLKIIKFRNLIIDNSLNVLELKTINLPEDVLIYISESLPSQTMDFVVYCSLDSKIRILFLHDINIMGKKKWNIITLDAKSSFKETYLQQFHNGCKFEILDEYDVEHFHEQENEFLEINNCYVSTSSSTIVCSTTNGTMIVWTKSSSSNDWTSFISAWDESFDLLSDSYVEISPCDNFFITCSCDQDEDTGNYEFYLWYKISNNNWNKKHFEFDNYLQNLVTSFDNDVIIIDNIDWIYEAVAKIRINLLYGHQFTKMNSSPTKMVEYDDNSIYIHYKNKNNNNSKKEIKQLKDEEESEMITLSDDSDELLNIESAECSNDGTIIVFTSSENNYIRIIDINYDKSDNEWDTMFIID